MLRSSSWRCRHFRARFTPGSAHPHRRSCRQCDAFATAVEQAAGARLPLPAVLRSGLREIASATAGEVLRFPVPRFPMPPALALRLRGLAPAAPAAGAPPEWLRNPRYAIAASALLAILLGPLLPAAADRGLQAVASVRAEVSPLLEQTGESGKEELDKFRSGVDRTVDAAAQSLRKLDASASGLPRRLSLLTQGEPHESR